MNKKSKTISKTKKSKNLNNKITHQASAIALPLYLVMPFIVSYLSVSAILGYYNFYDMGMSNEKNTHYMYYVIFPVLSIALFAIAELIVLALKKSRISVGHDHRFAIGMIITIFISLSYVFYSLDLVKDYPTYYKQDWKNVYMIWTGDPIIEINK